MHAAARILKPLVMSVAAVVLATGCAALNTISAQLTSFGNWPAQRPPGTYAFERLPSQQARPEAQQRLEDAAHPALEAAGFTAAAPGATPDVLVQVGVRITRYEAPWDDPLWWRGGFGALRVRPSFGVGFGFGSYGYPLRSSSTRYDREVALLLRNRADGAPLYEARASSEGAIGGSDEVLRAMFKAAMSDFPISSPVPHSASVTLGP